MRLDRASGMNFLKDRREEERREEGEERGTEMQPVAPGIEGEEREREKEKERETAVIRPSPASSRASLVVSSHLRTSFVSAASPSVFHAAFCPRVSPLNSGSVASSPWLSNGH
jgi:hypothetical protein